MSGDNAADSKRGEARGSGGTTKKSQNAGKQHNTKAKTPRPIGNSALVSPERADSR